MAQSMRQRSARVPPTDTKEALNEEWIRFFKERLEVISNSEVEHNNAKIINFSWPGEVLALVNNPAEQFHGSLAGIGRMRHEVFMLLYTHEQKSQTEAKLKKATKQQSSAKKSEVQSIGSGGQTGHGVAGQPEASDSWVNLDIDGQEIANTDAD